LFGHEFFAQIIHCSKFEKIEKMSQITAIVPFPPLIFSIKVVEDKNQDTPFLLLKVKINAKKNQVSIMVGTLRWKHNPEMK